MRRLLVGSIGVVLAAAAGSQIGFGQQKVEMMPGFGIPSPPAASGARSSPRNLSNSTPPKDRESASSSVTKALAYPWSLAFLPDGDMLVTERAGRLRIIRNGVLDPQPIAGVPASYCAANPACPARSTASWTSRCIRKFAAEQASSISRYTKPLDDETADDGDRARTLGRQRAHRGEGHLRGGRRRRRRRASRSAATACCS